LSDKIILGIDPGFCTTGYGILATLNKKTTLIDFGYIKLSPKKSLSQRIGIFYEVFKQKFIDYKITEISLETPFLGKNIQSFLKLGYLRGILYLLAHQQNIPIKEFSPREVKSFVTGYGGASKEQVAKMILRLFPTIDQIKVFERNDVTDAIAVCLSGYWYKKPN
jgi:crossover junction endodeoxyribonuclease RuvC